MTAKPRPFRFGVNCVTTSATELQETARRAEALGFDTLIAQDHFANQLAPMPALLAAAAVTSRLRLATIVLDNDFRHPAVVAKEAASVDIISGGRMELGLGAGWVQSDYTKTGIPFDSAAVRLGRLAEAVLICKALFEQESPLSFDGEYYHIEQLEPLPRPIQKPRPPIMVGGRQRRMLSLAGREADIVGISLLDRRGPGQPQPPSFAEKVDWVRAAAGARFDQIELHVNATVVDTTDRPQATLEQAAERTGQSVASVLESPGTFVGSIDTILDVLHARRQHYGVSYWVIQARAMEAFAPVIARL